MFENPCAKGEMKDYRKSLVLRLDNLEELDKIKVIQAERLTYRGLLRVDIQKLLDKFRDERQESDAKERMELELYIEYMEGLGMESTERMRKSLDEFAKLDEFMELKKKFVKIIGDAKEQFEEGSQNRAELKLKVEQEVTKVMNKYRV